MLKRIQCLNWQWNRRKGEMMSDYRLPPELARQIEPVFMKYVDHALGEYEREVNASKLRPNTKHTYLRHAKHFVRWMHGDFTPGGTL